MGKIGTERHGEWKIEMASRNKGQLAKWHIVFENNMQAWRSWSIIWTDEFHGMTISRINRIRKKGQSFEIVSWYDALYLYFSDLLNTPHTPCYVPTWELIMFQLLWRWPWRWWWHRENPRETEAGSLCRGLPIAIQTLWCRAPSMTSPQKIMSNCIGYMHYILLTA